MRGIRAYIAEQLRRLSGKRGGRHRRLVPHGPAGIRAVGHRKYIGGKWEEIGRLQFDLLVDQGMQPHHYVLDVACGSLRAGVHLIPYLDPEHYMGIDKESELIDAGIEHELTPEIVRRKKPQFVVSADFEFERFDHAPDFAIAQSLFTHLPAPLIDRCLAKLRPIMADDGRFFVTFFESEEERDNPERPHDHDRFYYTRSQMETFGTKNGWRMTYIGNWDHPRDQMLVRYSPGDPTDPETP